MTSYKNHGSCRRYTGENPVPVQVSGLDRCRWIGAMTASAVIQSPILAEAAFRPLFGGRTLEGDFDRVFTLHALGGTWYIRTRLCGRTAEEHWPQLDLFDDRQPAFAGFAAITKRYEADPRWQTVTA